MMKYIFLFAFAFIFISCELNKEPDEKLIRRLTYEIKLEHRSLQADMQKLSKEQFEKFCDDILAVDSTLENLNRTFSRDSAKIDDYLNAAQSFRKIGEAYSDAGFDGNTLILKCDSLINILK